MANIRGKSTKGMNLLGSYSDSQITKNDKGEMTGAFVAIQVDQRNLPEGEKADTNPYLYSSSYKNEKTGRENTGHGDWYSKSQLESMQAGGKTEYDKDGERMNMAFKGNIMSVKDKEGKQKLVVCTPTKSFNPEDPKYADKSPEELGKLQAACDEFNEKHQITPNDNSPDKSAVIPTPEVMKEQFDVTLAAKAEKSREKAASKEMAAEKEAPGAEAPEAVESEPEME